MSRGVRHVKDVVALSTGIVVAVFGLSPIRAQSADAVAKLSGTWHLNKAQSTKPESITTVLPGQTDMSTILAAQAHEIVRVMVQAPAELIITATPADVTLSTEGVSDKYTLNNRIEDLSFGKTTGPSKAKWDKAQVRQEVDLGRIIVVRVWQVSSDGKHLTVTTSIDHGPGDDDFKPVKNVYDKQ